MLSHPLTNFEIQRYHDEPRFNGAYLADNLLNKIKDRTYVINQDEYNGIGNYWIALYLNENTKTCFDSFRVEHIPKEMKKLIGNKSITRNAFRIQANYSIMCRYFCIGFNDIML